MKTKLFLALFLSLMLFAACETVDVNPQQEIEQQSTDSTEEEEEGTTSEGS